MANTPAQRAARKVARQVGVKLRPNGAKATLAAGTAARKPTPQSAKVTGPIKMPTVRGGK